MEGEGAALAKDDLDVDGAAVGLNDVFFDGETRF